MVVVDARGMMPAMLEGDRPQSLTQDKLKDTIWKELQGVRRRGIGRLDTPGRKIVPTQSLEIAARKVPEWHLSMTKSTAINALLKHEVSRVDATEYREQLILSFGLRDDLDNTNPKSLREGAACRAGESSLNYARRSPMGTELKTLYVLAGQIAADFLQDEGTAQPKLHPAPPLPKGPITRYKKSRWLLAVVTVPAVVVVILATVKHLPSKGHPGQQQSGQHSSKTDGASSSLPTPTDLGQSVLQTSIVNHYKDGMGGWGAIFPRANSTAASEFIAQPYMPDDVHRFYGHELAAGAFGNAGIYLEVNFEGLSDREITINDIRPINRHTEPVPTGAAVIIGTQGAPNINIQYSLDSPVPVGRNIETGRPYFESFHIPLTRGKKETLGLEFRVQQRAYSFNVAIEYEVGGQTYTRILQQANGQPFRATGALCPRWQGATSSPLQYEIVRTSYANPADPAHFYAMKTTTAQTLCEG